MAQFVRELISTLKVVDSNAPRYKNPAMDGKEIVKSSLLVLSMPVLTKSNGSGFSVKKVIANSILYQNVNMTHKTLNEFYCSIVY